MAKRLDKRLTALELSRKKVPGLYPDGGGLYLQITDSGARSWVLRYMIDGRARYMGLGSASAVTLAEARGKAQDARKLKADGIDPIAAREALISARRAEDARAITFKDAAAAYIRSHKAGWRNEKHGDQWENTLTAYAYPFIGNLPVQEIDAGLVLKVLEPIWETKTETASRVRGRIEAVLDWSKARGHRTGDNPARWRGHLDNLLPKRSKVQRVRHHPALPFAKVGAFMVDLRKQDGMAAQALEFLILTATRTGEAIGARWDEIDLKGKTWTIPAERIKAGRDHKVPLSAPAVGILKFLLPLRTTDAAGKVSPWVFPGVRSKSLGNMALLQLLKRMGRSEITAHGFRSTFRDWASEQTNFPRDVAEMALAHAIGDKVEAAYRRGDLFEKRRKLMEAWSGYLAIDQLSTGKAASSRRKQVQKSVSKSNK